MIKIVIPVLFCFISTFLQAQDTTALTQDTTIYVGKKVITLSEVVVDNKLNVPTFINRIKNDSSFYKAFRNLHILGFTAINDIRMLDKDRTSKASCFSKT